MSLTTASPNAPLKEEVERARLREEVERGLKLEQERKQKLLDEEVERAALKLEQERKQLREEVERAAALKLEQERAKGLAMDMEPGPVCTYCMSADTYSMPKQETNEAVGATQENYSYMCRSCGKGFGEMRSKPKTKEVAGQHLHTKDFAWVGDANDPETWKLPLMDESHCRNALARFNQTEGIPEDKKAVVLAKIHAAAKKHGIKVDEGRSAELAGVDEDRRFIPVEIRRKGQTKVIVGHIPYNALSEPMGGFREKLMPHAFKEHLDNGGEVVAKYEHGMAGSKIPLGTRSAGTLRLEHKPNGLDVEIEPGEKHPEGAGLIESIERGDFKGLSFGMRVHHDNGEKWTRDGLGRVREIHRAQLTDVSPTMEPAYKTAHVGVALRSLAAVEEGERLMGLAPLADGVQREGSGFKKRGPDGKFAWCDANGSPLAAPEETRSDTTAAAFSPGTFVCFFDAHPGRLMFRHCHGCILQVAESLSFAGLTLTGSKDDLICLVEEWIDCGDGVSHSPCEDTFFLKRSSWLTAMEMPTGVSDDELIALDDVAADQSRRDKMQLAQYSGGQAASVFGFSADVT
jgi:hypothetical protein